MSYQFFVELYGPLQFRQSIKSYGTEIDGVKDCIYKLKM